MVSTGKPCLVDDVRQRTFGNNEVSALCIASFALLAVTAGLVSCAGGGYVHAQGGESESVPYLAQVRNKYQVGVFMLEEETLKECHISHKQLTT